MVKRIDATSNWVMVDASRGDGFLSSNTSSAEATADIFDFVDEGFVLKSATTNELSGQYIFMAYAEGTAFDGTKTLTNYDYATTDEVLTINEGTLMAFASGFNANGELNLQELVGAGVTYTLGAGFEDKTLWVYKDRGGVYGSTEFVPLEGINRAQADKFGVVSPLNAATRTTDKHFGYESATGVALASGDDVGAFWHAFEPSGTGWAVTATSGVTAQYKFNEPRALKSWRLQAGGQESRLPRRFTVEGSNDGLNWTAIDSTYTASDYVGSGASLWGDIQDTSANTTAYIYCRLNITANNGDATVTGAVQIEFNTITPSDYYNVIDGKVYNNAGTVIDRTYLAKVNTGASGEILNFENLPVAKIKGVDAELQGDLTVHGDISNRGVCTAWVNFDGETDPPTIRDSYNVYDVVDIEVGEYDVIFDEPMDSIGYAVTGTAGNLGSRILSARIMDVDRVRVRTYNGGDYVDGDLNSIAIFGGKSI